MTVGAADRGRQHASVYADREPTVAGRMFTQARLVNAWETIPVATHQVLTRYALSCIVKVLRASGAMYSASPANLDWTLPMPTHSSKMPVSRTPYGRA
jgi:hypothetical protein